MQYVRVNFRGAAFMRGHGFIAIYSVGMKWYLFENADARPLPNKNQLEPMHAGAGERALIAQWCCQVMNAARM
jgi:hypothetical protein